MHSDVNILGVTRKREIDLSTMAVQNTENEENSQLIECEK